MTLLSPFNSRNVTFAYELRYSLGFRTYRGTRILADSARQTELEQILDEICERSDYHLLECEFDANWARLLLSLRPSHAPADVARKVKANASRMLRERFPAITNDLKDRPTWSRGYYVRGIGDVTNEIVQNYVARQKQHHEIELGNSRELARYEHPNPRRYFDLQPYSHCFAEYNCHLVCCPLGHVSFFEQAIADEFLEYVRRIAERKRFELLSASLLDDHLHLFAALRPNQCPQDLAFAMMNNTAYWMESHNPGAMKLWDAAGVWSPSAFLGTAGAVTTDVVRAHLRNRRLLEESGQPDGTRGDHDG